MLDYGKLEKIYEDNHDVYIGAEEFPHIVIENFYDEKALENALAVFPKISDEGWIHYKHVNEKKGGLNKREMIPAELLAIIDELNSQKFINWLEKLTGIKNLKPDPNLEGGGIHQIEKGGFLNIHADFTAHPHNKFWRRRVNVLLYLNKDWEDAYGGKLELWRKDMSGCFEDVLPIFNRAVIFNTDKKSYHGHPHPLTCPDGRTRKSIALYYFTEEEKPAEKIATNYQARPEDSATKALLIKLDKKILSLYNKVKGVLGINDDFVSKVLNFLSRGKK